MLRVALLAAHPRGWLRGARDLVRGGERHGRGRRLAVAGARRGHHRTGRHAATAGHPPGRFGEQSGRSSGRVEHRPPGGSRPRGRRPRPGTDAGDRDRSSLVRRSDGRGVDHRAGGTGHRALYDRAQPPGARRRPSNGYPLGRDLERRCGNPDRSPHLGGLSGRGARRMAGGRNSGRPRPPRFSCSGGIPGVSPRGSSGPRFW
jgi:hypothetical protein